MRVGVVTVPMTMSVVMVVRPSVPAVVVPAVVVRVVVTIVVVVMVAGSVRMAMNVIMGMGVMVIAVIGRGSGADPLHVVVMAFLGKPLLRFEAQDLLPVLAELAVHQVRPPAGSPRRAPRRRRAPRGDR